MNIKKPLLIAGAVASIGAAGLGGSALAASNTDSADGDSLVTKLAQKFNLKQEDVQAVFDEHRSTREAERQAQVEEALNQAVTDGKLTTEQKNKLLAKQKELQARGEAEHETWADKTEEERQTAMEAKREEMQTKRAELEKWASDNGIPTEYLRYVFGGHRGFGSHR